MQKQFKNKFSTWFSIILFLLFLPIHSRANEDKTALAEKYYIDGLKLYNSGNLDSAIVKLKQALRFNNKSATIQHQLALTYMEMGTVYGRFRANLAFKETLRLDGNNIDYRFDYAMLLLKMEMSAAAKNELKKIIKQDPEYYRAWYHLGLLRDKNAMRYRDMIDPENDAIIYFHEFAEEDKNKAIYYYNKVIAVKPDFTEVYYRLGLLYFEYNQLYDMIELLEKAVQINPADKNCHLFLGFAYYHDDQYLRAEQEYEQAIQLMTADEKTAFLSVELLMRPEKYKNFVCDSLNYTQNILQFWKTKDPLLISEVNERKLEHYSRFAYANLRYSDFNKGIDGWRSDPGKVYIRYGKPEILYRTRPEIGTSGDGNPKNPLNHSKEVWIYPDFEFIFEDRFLQNKYEFAWGNTPENDYRNVYERLVKETPDYYHFIQKDRLIEIAFDLCMFRGKNKDTRLEINYAIPVDSLHFVLIDDQWTSHINSGIFLMDNQMNDVYQSSTERFFYDSTALTINDNSFIIDSQSLEADSDSLQLVFELQDKESQKHASIRKNIFIPPFDANQLQISDILLAFDIEQDTASSIILNREALKIQSNPLKLFQAGQPVCFYYEIYNLQQNRFGATSFNVEYTVGSSEHESNIFNKLLESLRFKKTSGAITTSYSYVGQSATEHQFQRMELPMARSGDHALTVTVTDLNNNQKTSVEIEFNTEAHQ